MSDNGDREGRNQERAEGGERTRDRSRSRDNGASGGGNAGGEESKLFVGNLSFEARNSLQFRSIWRSENLSCSESSFILFDLILETVNTIMKNIEIALFKCGITSRKLWTSVALLLFRWLICCAYRWLSRNCETKMKMNCVDNWWRLERRIRPFRHSNWC